MVLFMVCCFNTKCLRVHAWCYSPHQVDGTVSKLGATADVPVGVIVGSVIGGLILLAAVVAVLWKVRLHAHTLVNEQ